MRVFRWRKDGKAWGARVATVKLDAADAFRLEVCDREFQNDLRYSKSVASESSSEKNGIPDNYSDDAENT